MIVILAMIEVAPADADRAAALARDLAAETNKEDGCLLYAIGWDLSVPNLLRLSEWWRDAGDLRLHFASPHMKAFRAGLRQLTIGNIEIKRFEVSHFEDVDPTRPIPPGVA